MSGHSKTVSVPLAPVAPPRDKKPLHKSTKSIGDFTSPPDDEEEEEEEEDDESEWIEFVDDQGKKLYFNSSTRSVRLNDPKSGLAEDVDEQGNKWVAEVDDVPYGEDDLPANLAPSALRMGFDRARRNSAIAGDAWENKEVLEDPDQMVATAAAEEEDDTAEMTLENIVDTIGSMVFNLHRIIEIGQNLPSEAIDELKDIKDKVAHIHEQMEDGKQMTDDRNDVDALIDFQHLKWEWDNPWVHSFRAHATNQPYESWKFKEWHTPEFLSQQPLPPDSHQITCSVTLPSAAAPGVENNVSLSTTKIGVSDTDKVLKGIQAAYQKIRGGADRGKESDYVFKVQGLNDYMQPHMNFFDYQHVRTCVRDNLELKLSLVKRPDAVAVAEPYITELAKAYDAKVKPDLQPLTEELHKAGGFDQQWFQMKAFPMSRIDLPFRFKVCGLDNLDEVTLPRLGDYQISHIYLQFLIFHGTDVLEGSLQETEAEPINAYPRWFQWYSGSSPGSEILVSALPREARLGFYLMGKEKDKAGSVRLAYVTHQLVDYQGRLCAKSYNLRLWALPAAVKGKHGKKREDPDLLFRATNRDNLSSKHTCNLRIDFDHWDLPVVAPLEDTGKEPNKAKVGEEVNVKALQKTEAKALEVITKMDTLDVLTPEDKELVWRTRHSLLSQPSLLPKFLQSVKWGVPDFKYEAHRFLHLWTQPKSLSSYIEMLDVKYPDYTVRKFIVSRLRLLKDDELQLYLLQLTQCLKFECYHESPLARFLIERAIRNPLQVGHHFFWHLKAEMHNNPEFCERYGVLLEEYLSHCGRFAGELRKQNNAVLKMQRVAGLIVRLKREEGYADEAAMKEYTKELKKLNRTFFEPMGKFQIPLDPKWEASTLMVEKCRYMSSKMVPLWLVFKNADEDAPPIYIMFKSGDDLRQDILTLQMIRVMDKLWLEDGLDMRLKPYKCIATGVNEHGDGVGMIEIVLNSDTTSGIQLKYGGGAMGALKMDPIDSFLKDHNKENKYSKAVDNFIKSCAGYCVATFVLGIGDRHNGNIMVTKDGHLFHIDFGHFLGNFKKKFGVNRERAAFVFTPEMAFVMGGRRYKKHEHFKQFLQLCSNAFRILRVNAAFLETLFILMVSAGMPELMVEKDIWYMKDKLHLDVTEKKADKKLQSEINKSLDSTYRRFDNMIHNFKHG